jgi:hypothetical protein
MELEISVRLSKLYLAVASEHPIIVRATSGFNIPAGWAPNRTDFPDDAQ